MADRCKWADTLALELLNHQASAGTIGGDEWAVFISVGFQAQIVVTENSPGLYHVHMVTRGVTPAHDTDSDVADDLSLEEVVDVVNDFFGRIESAAEDKAERRADR